MKTKPIKAILLTLCAVTTIAIIVTSSCKKDKTTALTSDDTVSATTVFSKKVTAPPNIDGTIDAMWANVPTMQTTATVPNLEASIKYPGCDVFGGYEGDQYTVKIRSTHDASNIYFLVEWDDATLSADRNSWYYDTSSKRWKQQGTYACSSGVAVTPYYEDKFSFMFNINTPASSWNATTCYSTCHTGLVAPWEDAVKHYTNNPGEMTDVWHWKYVRTNYVHQVDDQRWVYQDPANPSSPSKGGRGDDSKFSGGYSDNKQTLTIATTTISVSVPKYVIPGKTGYYWITPSEISGGTAKLVTAVDTNGVLSYSGGTIDPSAGGYENGTGTKRFPSITAAQSFGSLGDVTAFGKHTGTGWVLELSRKLTTGFTDDVAFETTNDYMFGIGLFDNAGIAHAIKTNLTLQFEK